MIELTEDFKAKVLAALTEARDRYDGSDANFAKKYGINKTVYSSLKKVKRRKRYPRPNGWNWAGSWEYHLTNANGTWLGPTCSI